eukprot:9178630-Pyramimonas_sp.AAC.1
MTNEGLGGAVLPTRRSGMPRRAREPPSGCTPTLRPPAARDVRGAPCRSGTEPNKRQTWRG